MIVVVKWVLNIGIFLVEIECEVGRCQMWPFSCWLTLSPPYNAMNKVPILLRILRTMIIFGSVGWGPIDCIRNRKLVSGYVAILMLTYTLTAQLFPRNTHLGQVASILLLGRNYVQMKSDQNVMLTMMMIWCVDQPDGLMIAFLPQSR